MIHGMVHLALINPPLIFVALIFSVFWLDWFFDEVVGTARFINRENRRMREEAAERERRIRASPLANEVLTARRLYAEIEATPRHPDWLKLNGNVADIERLALEPTAEELNQAALDEVAAERRLNESNEALKDAKKLRREEKALHSQTRADYLDQAQA